MLNQFKIGTKLTVGFLLVLTLLVTVAGVGYIALEAGQKSTQELLLVENNLGNILGIRILINRAQVQAAKGSLSRDFHYEQARQDIDKELDELANSMKEILSKANLDSLETLLAEYNAFKNADYNWYRAEEQRIVEQKAIIDAASLASEALQACSNIFLQEAESTKEGEGNEERVLHRFVQQAHEVETFITELLGLRRGYYALMAEPNYEERRRQGEGLLTGAEELQKQLVDFARTVVDPVRRRMVEDATQNVEQWGTALKTNLELLATQSQCDSDMDASSGKMTAIVESMVKVGNDRVADITKEMSARDARMTAIMIGTSIFAVIFGLGCSFVLSRNIGGGIRIAVAETEHIAKTGDLSHEMPPEFLHRKDEVGDLAHCVELVLVEFRDVATMAKELAAGDWRNDIKIRGDLDLMNKDLSSMLGQVNDVLHEINENVTQVAIESADISNAAHGLADGAQEAAASLEQITASMSEISSQTRKNAESAGQARDLAQKTSQAAAEGQEAMQRMTGAMGRITQNSHEIQRVIKVIDDIAFQTNLLALNAAVEAARAGQHGKGFAVVAEEVRNLAARSAKAAKETSELIAKSGHEIEQGGTVASHTAEVLNTIVEQIKQTTELISGIAIASNEQAQGVNQVAIGLQQIDSVTQQNTAAAEESASAANEMSGMAANLKKLVGQFKLR